MSDDTRFRDIVEGLPQTVYEIDLSGRVTYTNPRGFQVTGYTAEDLAAGLSAIQLFVPENADDIRENIRIILEKGEIGPNEHTLLTKDGRRVPVMVFSSPIIENGKTIGLRGMMLDLTERNQIVGELKESEERYRNLVDQALVGIVVHSGGRLLYANEQAVQLLGGQSADDVIGKAVLRFIHPDSRETVKNRVRAIYEKDVPAPPMEEKFLRLDGGILDVEVAGSIVDFRGKPAAQVVFRDIGFRKKSEQTLLAIARGVSASVGHSFFRELVMHLAGALEADYAFIGTPPGEKLDRIRTEAACADGNIVENFEYDLRGTPCQIVVGERSCLIPHGVQAEFPDDELLVEMGVEGYVGARLTGSDGEVLGIIVVLYKREVPSGGLAVTMLDIFASRAVAEIERMRSEDERVALEAQLFQSQKTESLGRLAGGVAHDINNLITPILGYSELIAEDLPEGSEFREPIEAIHSTANRAKAIIEQLLAYGRRQTLAVNNVRLCDLVRDLTGMLQRTVREDIELVIECDASEWSVRVDVVRIEQVVVNLVVNAQDAMPAGGRLEIDIRDRTVESGELDELGVSGGDWVNLSVRDTGSGMDDDTIAMAFEPFYTTKPKGQGTGLGLSTVMGIVRQHEGFVTIESDPGRGTVFNVLLPRWEDGPEGRTSEPHSIATPGEGETILVVEDDDSVRDLVVTVLQRRGYNVRAAADPTDCLELLDRIPAASIDLLLTDVVMPVMNGKDLYELISKRVTGLKVLYMSGYTNDILDPRGVIGTDVNFLQKPFSSKRLCEKIREVLED